MISLAKSPTVEAIKYGNGIFVETPDWLYEATRKPPGAVGSIERSGDFLLINTTVGRLMAGPGDWIVRNDAGEIYPMAPYTFILTYRRADAAQIQVRYPDEVRRAQ